MNHLDKVSEAIFNLHRAIGAIHPNANFEIRVDRLTINILNNEYLEQNIYKPNPFIGPTQSGKIKHFCGHNIKEMEF